jgi:cytoskeletal protein CcmA (bactofilin family)
MFGGKNEKASVNLSTVTNVTNAFTESTKMIGDISTDNDIRIDGELKGNLDCKGRVIIGPQGKVEGTIVCQNAIIEGLFVGDIKVKELLSLKETASVTGDIKTDKLNVQPGAYFTGKCEMAGQKLKPVLEKSPNA